MRAICSTPLTSNPCLAMLCVVVGGMVSTVFSLSWELAAAAGGVTLLVVLTLAVLQHRGASAPQRSRTANEVRHR